MKTAFRRFCGLALILLLPLRAAEPALPERAELAALMRRVTDYQMQAFGEKIPSDWKTGTFLTGVLAAYQATGEAHFHDLSLAWAEKAKWKVAGKPYFADDICVAQTYLELNAIKADPHRIANIQAKLAGYFDKTTIVSRECNHPSHSEEQRPFIGRNVWWWCDSLYMAPPVLTHLAQATGDPRHLQLLHQLYWDAVAYLYVPADKLFFRDSRFFKKHTPSGKNVYWSRGNGWVYAGLVRILDTLPASDPRRGDYLKLFQDLTEGILKYQGEDGLWRTSLNEPTWYPEKESSGTSFFCYGLLAGVNRGWLTKEQALAPALKAWAGLQTCLSPGGKLGYAQGGNEKPGPVSATQSIDYTQGALLLAAAELYKLAPAKP